MSSSRSRREEFIIPEYLQKSDITPGLYSDNVKVYPDPSEDSKAVFLYLEGDTKAFQIYKSPKALLNAAEEFEDDLKNNLEEETGFATGNLLENPRMLDEVESSIEQESIQEYVEKMLRERLADDYEPDSNPIRLERLDSGDPIELDDYK